MGRAVGRLVRKIRLNQLEVRRVDERPPALRPALVDVGHHRVAHRAFPGADISDQVKPKGDRVRN